MNQLRDEVDDIFYDIVHDGSNTIARDGSNTIAHDVGFDKFLKYSDNELLEFIEGGPVQLSGSVLGHPPVKVPTKQITKVVDVTGAINGRPTKDTPTKNIPRKEVPVKTQPTKVSLPLSPPKPQSQQQLDLSPKNVHPPKRSSQNETVVSMTVPGVNLPSPIPSSNNTQEMSLSIVVPDNQASKVTRSEKRSDVVKTALEKKKEMEEKKKQTEEKRKEEEIRREEEGKRKIEAQTETDMAKSIKNLSKNTDILTLLRENEGSGDQEMEEEDGDDEEDPKMPKRRDPKLSKIKVCIGQLKKAGVEITYLVQLLVSLLVNSEIFTEDHKEKVWGCWITDAINWAKGERKKMLVLIDKNMNTVLHGIAYNKMAVDYVKIFKCYFSTPIEKYVNIEGKTPLMYCFEDGYGLVSFELVKELTKFGIDVNAKDDFQKTFKDYIDLTGKSAESIYTFYKHEQMFKELNLEMSITIKGLVDKAFMEDSSYFLVFSIFKSYMYLDKDMITHIENHLYKNPSKVVSWAATGTLTQVLLYILASGSRSNSCKLFLVACDYIWRRIDRQTNNFREYESDIDDFSKKILISHKIDQKDMFLSQKVKEEKRSKCDTIFMCNPRISHLEIKQFCGRKDVSPSLIFGLDLDETRFDLEVAKRWIDAGAFLDPVIGSDHVMFCHHLISFLFKKKDKLKISFKDIEGVAKRMFDAGYGKTYKKSFFLSFLRGKNYRGSPEDRERVGGLIYVIFKHVLPFWSADMEGQELLHVALLNEYFDLCHFKFLHRHGFKLPNQIILAFRRNDIAKWVSETYTLEYFSPGISEIEARNVIVDNPDVLEKFFSDYYLVETKRSLLTLTQLTDKKYDGNLLAVPWIRSVHFTRISKFECDEDVETDDRHTVTICGEVDTEYKVIDFEDDGEDDISIPQETITNKGSPIYPQEEDHSNKSTQNGSLSLDDTCHMIDDNQDRTEENHKRKSPELENSTSKRSKKDVPKPNKEVSPKSTSKNVVKKTNGRVNNASRQNVFNKSGK